MFNKYGSMENLYERVRKLETGLSDLERLVDSRTSIYVDKYPEVAPWEPLMGRHEKVELRDAITRVLDHCGLKLSYTPPVSGAVKVEKVKK